MTLRSRPGLVSSRSRPEMDVATWFDWRQEVRRRDQGFFGSRQGRSVGGTEAGRDLDFWCRDLEIPLCRDEVAT